MTIAEIIEKAINDNSKRGLSTEAICQHAEFEIKQWLGKQGDSPKTQPMPSQQPIQNPSFGQKAVGINFNPSGDDQVGFCKQGFATEIDRMNDLRQASTSPEQKRLCSVAITELQTAQMWAVKALTWKD